MFFFRPFAGPGSSWRRLAPVLGAAAPAFLQNAYNTPPRHPGKQVSSNPNIFHARTQTPVRCAIPDYLLKKVEACENAVVRVWDADAALGASRPFVQKVSVTRA